MAWSTRQLADLAGTTVKAVRHYHEIGLLDEPERAPNGYKRYQVSHLVRLLQIKRLTDLGVPLVQIATMSDADQDPEQTIRDLDAELEATIERLQRIRSELKGILQHRAPLDVPAEFSAVAGGLSDSDRALLMVYSRVVDEDAVRDLRHMLAYRDPLDDEFDALPADAHVEAIQSLAERYAPDIRRQEAEYPWKARPVAYDPRGGAVPRNIVGQAILALYNPAQLQVMRRAHFIVHPEAAPTTDGEDR